MAPWLFWTKAGLLVAMGIGIVALHVYKRHVLAQPLKWHPARVLTRAGVEVALTDADAETLRDALPILERSIAECRAALLEGHVPAELASGGRTDLATLREQIAHLEADARRARDRLAALEA